MHKRKRIDATRGDQWRIWQLQRKRKGKVYEHERKTLPSQRQRKRIQATTQEHHADHTAMLVADQTQASTTTRKGTERWKEQRQRTTRPQQQGIQPYNGESKGTGKPKGQFVPQSYLHGKMGHKAQDCWWPGPTYTHTHTGLIDATRLVV
eukprot:6378038-Amphidinium_carterae.2